MSSPLPSLANRVVLVTGSGQGLGRAVALACARAGATVLLHGRKAKKLEAVYDEIVARGDPQPFILTLDLEIAGSAELAGLAQAIQSQAGRLDGIVHNAALLANLAPIEHQTLEQWLSMLRVNTAAPFALTRACLPLLKTAQDARVVFTLDSHGVAPKAYWGGYAVSKAALAALVAILADEWESRPNLRVHGVVPGAIDSPMRKQTHPAESPESQMSLDRVVPLYVELLGGGTFKSGEVVDAGEWVDSCGG